MAFDRRGFDTDLGRRGEPRVRDDDPPAHVRVRAPAKINLALKVGPPRTDGYHPLATVYHAVSLYDEISAEPAPAGRFPVSVTGEGAAHVPRTGDNLVVRAGRLLARQFRVRRGAAFTITKAIPVAGGLAGGSADGAAALVACAALWGIDVPPVALAPLAAELGSDVPFALVGGTAVGSGRGEEVVPALAEGTHHWVLVFGHRGLSTPAVYRRYDELVPGPPAPVVPAELMAALRAGDSIRLGRALSNDLQPAALDLQPRLRAVLEAAADHGAAGAVVSGSGPTVAVLARDEAAAIDLGVAISGLGIARGVRRVVGPVHGATRLAN